MGGAATPRCRGSTLAKPQLLELNLPTWCWLLTWKMNAYFYLQRRRDFTRLRSLPISRLAVMQTSSSVVLLQRQMYGAE